MKACSLQVKTQQGRGLPQQWVFGGICRETPECFMYTVPNRSADTLLPIIRNSIRPGTTVPTRPNGERSRPPQCFIYYLYLFI